MARDIFFCQDFPATSSLLSHSLFPPLLFAPFLPHPASSLLPASSSSLRYRPCLLLLPRWIPLSSSHLTRFPLLLSSHLPPLPHRILRLAPWILPLPPLILLLLPRILLLPPWIPPFPPPIFSFPSLPTSPSLPPLPSSSLLLPPQIPSLPPSLDPSLPSKSWNP